MLTEINYKVLSYCEIPEDVKKPSWIEECGCDTYITFAIESEEERDELSDWIRKEYPELIDTQFMIHIDY